MDIRQKILESKDIPEKEIHVKEWDVDVLVIGLSGKERSQLMESAVTKNGQMNFGNLYADIVILCTHDPETREKIFKKADRDVLNEKSGSALERIAQIAMGMSGLDSDALDADEKN